MYMCCILCITAKVLGILNNQPDMTEKMSTEIKPHLQQKRKYGVNPLETRYPQTGTFTNREDPDEMPHNAAFHQGQHCIFLRLKKYNIRVLTRILKIGVKMLFIEKVRSFTILLFCDF